VTSLESGDALFLNNVQGPPPGCGCGNLQCRSWYNARGDTVAPSPYEHQDTYFTALFMQAVQEQHPALRVVPVLCAECERCVLFG
jgi:hypothetical protein